MQCYFKLNNLFKNDKCLYIEIFEQELLKNDIKISIKFSKKSNLKGYIILNKVFMFKFQKLSNKF